MMNNNTTFLINKNKIINNYKKYSSIGSVYYPLKTNSNKKVLNTLIDIFKTKDGFLISNLYHYKILKSLNVSPKKMCYINVLSSNKIIKQLYKDGVRFFVFDNIDSLKEIIKYADLKECKIAIRINTMEVFNDTLMHLGATTNECYEMLNILSSKCLNIGISFYLQTKIKEKPDSLDKMLKYIVENFKEYHINFLSIAGIKDYDHLNIELINNIKNEMNLKEIILEPGKYLVGATIDVITKVIRIKNINKKNIIIINNGIYSGLLDVVLYKEKFQFYLLDNKQLLKLSNEKDKQNNIEVTLCGGSSDSGDVIGTIYLTEECFNKINIGSELLIKNVGSYFEEFFMPYGGDIKKLYMEVDD
jgi:diaminopimelate decarboxylase